MNRRIQITLILFLLAAPATAQAPRCPEQERPLQELLEEYLLDRKAQNSASEGTASTPREAPTSAQIAAPSSMGNSTSLLDGAGSTSLVGLALDSGVSTGEDGAITLSFNPFTLAMAKNPEVFYNQSLYEKKSYERLRRLSATVSLGGEGETFDRDGDGEADEALEASSLDDVVGWELRFRLGKHSRDRREAKNFKEFKDRIKPIMGGLGQAVLSVTQGTPQWRMLVDAECGNTPGVCLACVSPEEWDTITEQVWFQDAAQPAVKLVDATQSSIDKAWAEAVKIVDNRPIVTLTLGGISRKEDFGTDDFRISLRGAWLNNTFNAEWTTKDGTTSAPDPTTLKIGWQYSAFVMKGVLGKDGAEISGGGTYETFDNVPLAKHSTNSKIYAKLELPLVEGMKLPLSITWANHKDLLSDGDEIVGHFGINVDFGSIFGRNTDG